MTKVRSEEQLIGKNSKHNRIKLHSTQFGRSVNLRWIRIIQIICGIIQIKFSKYIRPNARGIADDQLCFRFQRYSRPSSKVVENQAHNLF